MQITNTYFNYLISYIRLRKQVAAAVDGSSLPVFVFAQKSLH